MEYIDKEKLMEEVNDLSTNGEVRVTAVNLSGQDQYCPRSSITVHLSLAGLTVSDAVMALPIRGENHKELYSSMVQAINDKLDEIAGQFKDNRLKLNSSPHG